MRDDKPDANIGRVEYELHHQLRTADPNTCVMWTKCVNQSGLPYMKFRGRRIVSVRRLIYAWAKDGFPAMPWTGCNLTTTCGNSRCINPHHITEA